MALDNHIVVINKSLLFNEKTFTLWSRVWWASLVSQTFIWMTFFSMFVSIFACSQPTNKLEVTNKQQKHATETTLSYLLQGWCNIINFVFINLLHVLIALSVRPAQRYFILQSFYVPIIKKYTIKFNTKCTVCAKSIAWPLHKALYIYLQNWISSYGYLSLFFACNSISFHY